jgi:Xaa-Pro aminopeptidase
VSAFGRRRDRLRDLMAAAGAEAFLVTHLPDVHYLSGYSGSNGALLVTADDQALATDVRYELQAAQECPGIDVVITRRLVPDLLGWVRERGIVHVGFDASLMSVAGWRRAGDDVPGVELVPAKVDIAGLRMVKDADEVAALRQACDVSVRALEALLGEVRVGMTEIEVARLLELRMGLLGAPDRAFDSIVAAGPHSAIPHHQPTARPLAAGDLLKIDFGARWDGYHADCTRTFIVAARPQDWQAEIHGVVEAAQQAGIAALAPGVRAAVVDTAARRVIEDAGYGDFFGHGLGHGVGLEIHEPPFLGSSSPNTVEAGVPLTVEPGIYLPDRGGVRIEDTVLVTEDGPEVLTQFPRDLARIG